MRPLILPLLWATAVAAIPVPSHLDLNRDGVVEAAEVETVALADHGIRRDVAKQIFRKADGNNDSILRDDETKKAEELMRDEALREADRWVQSHDTDHDGGIGPSEFFRPAFLSVSLPRNELENIYRTVDREKDGALDAAEVLEARRMLRARMLQQADLQLTEFDSDSDHRLGKSEALVLADREYDVGTRRAEQIFNEADLNGDGQIGGVEMAGLMELLRAAAVEASEDKLKSLDRNGNGELSYKEAKAKFAVDGRTFKKIFKQYDINKNLFVDPPEFVSIQSEVAKIGKEPHAAAAVKVIHVHPRMGGHQKGHPRERRDIDSHAFDADDDLSISLEEDDPDFGLRDGTLSVAGYDTLRARAEADGVAVGDAERRSSISSEELGDPEAVVKPKRRDGRRKWAPEEEKMDLRVPKPRRKVVLPKEVTAELDRIRAAEEGEGRGFRTVTAVDEAGETGSSKPAIATTTQPTTSNPAEETITVESTESTTIPPRETEPTRKSTATLNPVGFTVTFGRTAVLETSTKTVSDTVEASGEEPMEKVEESKEMKKEFMEEMERKTEEEEELEMQPMENEEEGEEQEGKREREDRNRGQEKTERGEEVDDDQKEDASSDEERMKQDEEDGIEGLKMIVAEEDGEEKGAEKEEKEQQGGEGAGVPTKEKSEEESEEEFSFSPKRFRRDVEEHEDRAPESETRRVPQGSMEWARISEEKLRTNGGMGGGRRRPIEETVIDEPWRYLRSK